MDDVVGMRACAVSAVGAPPFMTSKFPCGPKHTTHAITVIISIVVIAKAFRERSFLVECRPVLQSTYVCYCDVTPLGIWKSVTVSIVSVQPMSL